MSSESDSDVESVPGEPSSSAAATDANVPLIGKIYSVHVENFITFTNATIEPGKELNILIGPNGTGKSSMVAAIVLGMGGSTKVLSTAKIRLADYVKNGKEKATITIRLHKDNRGGLYNFVRSFGRDNKSTWKMDGRKVSAEEYLCAVHALNIQVENLCQFLPQDRVQDFAKQNPEELFRSTQLSVCKEETTKQFDRLIEMRHEQTTGTSMRQKREAQLTECEQRLAVLAEAVQQVKQRDSMNDKRDNIGKKIAWIDFEKCFAKCKEIRDDYHLAEKKFQKDAKVYKDLEQNASSMKRQRAEYDKQRQIESEKRIKCENELDRIVGQMDAVKNANQKAKNDLAFVRSTAADYEREVEQCRLIESAFRIEYEELLAQTDSAEVHATKLRAIEVELAKINDNIEKLGTMRSNLNTEIETIGHKKRVVDNLLQAVEDQKSLQMNLMRDKFPDTFKAMQWVEANRELFSGQVFNPIMVELALKRVEHAKYVEAAVPLRDLLAFTCTNVEDMNLLLKKVRVEMRLNCNAILSNPAMATPHLPNAAISSMHHLGARSFLIESIEAPAPIMNYLCKSYRIQNILIGEDELEANTDRLPPWVHLYFTTHDRIQINTSRYSSERITISTPVAECRVLNVRRPAQDVAQWKWDRDELIRKMDSFRNKRGQIETAMASADAEYRKYVHKKNELGGIQARLQEAKKKWNLQVETLRRRIADRIDLDAENEKWLTFSRQSVKKLLKFRANAVQVFEQLTTVCTKDEEAKYRLDKFKSSTASVEVQIMTSKEQMERSKDYVDRINRLLEEAKKDCKEKQMHAMKMTNNSKPSDGNKFAFKKQFDELSDDVERLQEEMAEIDAQLEFQTAPHRDAMREYEDRTRQLDQLKREIADSDRSAATIEQDLVRLHKKWFPGVQSMVNSINENFSRFMATMNCAGEVDLIRAAEHDYNTYGIEIRVKYRSNERLRPLDRNVQSGGERAVAIAVYSLSLQHLSQVPFRCVDEINQGMDSNNERRVFEMLVKIVARENQSQFFYVTPKLLENLACNHYVTCCIVFNGEQSTHDDYFLEIGQS